MITTNETLQRISAFTDDDSTAPGVSILYFSIKNPDCCMLLGCLFSLMSSDDYWKPPVPESVQQCRKHVQNRYLTLKIWDLLSWLRVQVTQARNFWIVHISSGPSFTPSSDFQSPLLLRCIYSVLHLPCLTKCLIQVFIMSLPWWNNNYLSSVSNPASRGPFHIDTRMIFFLTQTLMVKTHQ